ncbi:MAG: lycopene cyclase [Flavobacterium sp.]|nr:MAG: lycopene cyclase [Flavobacterium sp.]
MANKYDMIICGAGLAGLSLAYRAFSSGVWKDQKVLIIDKSKKNTNDRTWSFWEKSAGVFESLVYHQWNQLIFYTYNHQQINLNHLPYVYKTIRGLDFYNFTVSFLRTIKNVEWLEESVTSVDAVADYCVVKTATATYECTFAFNTLFKKPLLKEGEQYFLQHFKGITIRTSSEKFNSNQAFLMDFRTSQVNGTTFFYTLPMSENEVFVEYTLFSKRLLDEEVYDSELKTYIHNVLKLSVYEIIDSEFGVIPMTDYKFDRRSGNIMNIGTAGGDTRGSTGYTFTNVQKTITKILQSFKNNGNPFFKAEAIGFKEKLYDSTLLNVLAEGKYQGHQLFSDLFKNTDAKTVFSFLDGESTILEELSVMKSLKTWPFLKSFTKVLTKRL